MATEERETVSLIGSDKVEGTAVYGANDEKIGSIERVMIEKTSGRMPCWVSVDFLALATTITPCPGTP